MDFVGGRAQSDYVERTRGLDPARCLVAAVDVGKQAALALVADHHGQLVGAPVEFALTEPGVGPPTGVGAGDRVSAAGRAVAAGRGGDRRALAPHVGVPAGGRGTRRGRTQPGAREGGRATQGSRRLKSDLRDSAAMVELLVRGAGRRPQVRDAAMAAQKAWVAHGGERSRPRRR
jgi:hypothetical protein